MAFQIVYVKPHHVADTMREEERMGTGCNRLIHVATHQLQGLQITGQ